LLLGGWGGVVGHGGEGCGVAGGGSRSLIGLARRACWQPSARVPCQATRPGAAADWQYAAAASAGGLRPGRGISRGLWYQGTHALGMASEAAGGRLGRGGEGGAGR